MGAALTKQVYGATLTWSRDRGEEPVQREQPRAAARRPRRGSLAHVILLGAGLRVLVGLGAYGALRRWTLLGLMPPAVTHDISQRLSRAIFSIVYVYGGFVALQDGELYKDVWLAQSSWSRWHKAFFFGGNAGDTFDLMVVGSLLLGDRVQTDILSHHVANGALLGLSLWNDRFDWSCMLAATSEVLVLLGIQLHVLKLVGMFMPGARWLPRMLNVVRLLGLLFLAGYRLPCWVSVLKNIFYFNSTALRAGTDIPWWEFLFCALGCTVGVRLDLLWMRLYAKGLLQGR